MVGSLDGEKCVRQWEDVSRALTRLSTRACSLLKTSYEAGAAGSACSRFNLRFDCGELRGPLSLRRIPKYLVWNALSEKHDFEQTA